MLIEIDEKSGFCFGVVKAIKQAEDELSQNEHLYCLGDIVHNNAEVERLKAKGLITINHEQFKNLKDCKVLIRAHGEPPETYQIAKQNNITLIDASCPVVLRLQSRIKQSYKHIAPNKGQVVIFGKQGHAEVNGLVGQTDSEAIVIKTLADIDKIDFTKPVSLFSQTTMGIDDFASISEEIKLRMQKAQNTSDVPLYINDTICRQVANRAPQLKEFSRTHDLILFVSGKESSNGKVLYDVCKSINPNSYFVALPSEIESGWFVNVKSVGICGATSTPTWLMNEVADKVKAMNNEQ
jgi:4-hydroxy-3-methylbut-2-enyl diphosphate reductase